MASFIFFCLLHNYFNSRYFASREIKRRKQVFGINNNNKIMISPDFFPLFLEIT